MLAQPLIQPKRQSFTPQPRGSLVELTSKPSDIALVAPESPRPPEMMMGVRINAGADLSAGDIALHELLIAHAYEVDRSMEALEYSVSMKAIVRFLGEDARRDQVERSMKRLRAVTLDFDSDDRSRQYRDVPMITPWREIKKSDEFLCYAFPPPIRELMRAMQSYAYVELAAIADGSMASKYSPALYKHLALKSTSKSWQLSGDNEVFVQMTPEELATIIQFPGWGDGTLNVSKLRDFVKRSIDDLKAVRRFRTMVEVKQEAGRGRRVRFFNFTLTLQPPSSHMQRAIFDKATMVRGRDDERYQCRSDVWLKASLKFSRTVEFGTHRMIFLLWLIALQEAIDKRPVTSGYEHRQYRGERLLEEIDRIGANEAAWNLICEEAESPDLLEYRKSDGEAYRMLTLEAQVSRHKRIGRKTRHIERLIGKIKAAEQRRRHAAQEIASKQQSEVEQVVAGRIERPVFEIIDMPPWKFEQEVVALFDREWTGDRVVLVRLVCGDERHSRKITPGYHEYQKLLADLAPFTKGTDQ